MASTFALFYDPVKKKDMPINVTQVTHVYATQDIGGEPACIVVVGGHSLMLTVRGGLEDVYRALCAAVGQKV